MRRRRWLRIRAVGLEQVRQGIADVAKTQAPVLLQTALNKPADAGRCIRREGLPCRFALDDGHDNVGRCLAVKGLTPGKELEENAAERPDVGAPIDDVSTRLLGTHVGGRAHQRAIERQGDSRGSAGARRRPGHALGQAKVEDLGAAGSGEHDVAGFQVAVDDALLMRGVNGQRDLVRDPSRLGLRDAGPGPIAERDPGDELHRDRRSGRRLEEPVDMRDVRVIERRQQARFAGEARARFRIRSEGFGQHLDRHVARQREIPGPEHASHAAGANRRRDLVGPNPVALCQFRHRRDSTCPTLLLRLGEERGPERIHETRVDEAGRITLIVQAPISAELVHGRDGLFVERSVVARIRG